MANQAQRFIAYLRKHELCLVTAESCTAGMIIALLADVPGSGSFIDCGFLTYSELSKKRLLKVRQSTIDKHTLTSEQVAREMALGALHRSYGNAAITTTGITGSEPVDGIAPGTICFAWGFELKSHRPVVFSETKHFKGDRAELSTIAARYALRRFPHFHLKASHR